MLCSLLWEWQFSDKSYCAIQTESVSLFALGKTHLKRRKVVRHTQLLARRFVPLE